MISVQCISFDAILNLVRHKMINKLPENASFESVKPLLSAYLDCSADPDTTEARFGVLAEGMKYLDFASFLIRNIQTAIHDAKSDTPDEFYKKIMRILLAILPENLEKAYLNGPPNPKSEQARRLRLPALRHSLTILWTRFLDKELSDDLILDALMRLGDGQTRKLSEIRLLSTYVIAVFDPPSDVTASNSLSRAVTRTLLSLLHSGGLNYERLYPRLYRLLDYSLLTCPYADRFLIDLDVYLSSISISAATVASFTKRLAQLCLEAPLCLLPALLTLVANCLNRHQMCRVLVHRPENSTLKRKHPETGETSEGNFDAPSIGDPYDWDGEDFTASGALQSSLWEIACIERHYHPEIAMLAKRIRQIAGSASDFMPEIKNQIELGQRISKQVTDKALACLSILRATHARLPHLNALDGWVSAEPMDGTPDAFACI